MSLINDALRKAQGERPGAGTHVPTGSAPPRPPANWPRAALLAIAGALLLLAVTIWLQAFLLLRQDGEALPARTAQPVTSEASEEAPASDPLTAESPRVVAETPPPAEPEAPAVAPEPQVPAPPSRDVELAAWVDAIEVRGVMGNSGRVLLLLPDAREPVRVQVGAPVDSSHGLRLERIEPDALIFTDEAGNLYVRRF